MGKDFAKSNNRWWLRLAAFSFLLVLLFPLRLGHSWWLFATFSVVDVAVSLALIAVLVMAMFRGRLYLGDRGLSALLALPVFLSLSSLAWSVDSSMTFKSIVVYGAALAVFLITVSLFRKCSARSLVMLVMILPVALMATAVLSYLPGSILRPEVVMPSDLALRDGFLLSYRARFSHPFLGLSNSFASVLAMLLPLVLLTRRVGPWPGWSWVVAMLTLAGIIATGSRGVILALIVTYCIVLLWRLVSRARAPRGGISLLVTAVLIAAVFVWLEPTAHRHLTARLDVGNIENRLTGFAAVFDVLAASPEGIGSGISLGSVSDIPLRSVHNAYLQNLLWYGWVGGLLITLAMWIMPFYVLRIRTRTEMGSHAKKTLAISVLILMFVNVSQASWEGSLIRIWIYFVVALGVVIVRNMDGEDLRTALGSRTAYA